MEAPSIALAWEVNPFRMTEFIAHKVQICFTASGYCEQTHHFMKCDGTVNHRIVAGFIHICIHSGICKTEDHSLITYEGLIVAFYISNCTFARTTETHIAPHLADIPILVTLFFNCADPHIRKAHSKTIVEAASAIFDRKTHARHTGHIFCYRNRIRIYCMNQLICKLKVCNCLHMSIHGEIFAVVVEICSKTMVMV